MHLFFLDLYLAV